MKEPKWLDKDFVLLMHREQLCQHGGIATIREKGLFESCLDKPKNLFYYGSQDIVELGASYCIGFCKNPVFVDGNKRIASFTMEFFLIKNGYEVVVNDAEIYLVIINLASSKWTPEIFTQWLKDSTKPIDKK